MNNICLAYLSWKGHKKLERTLKTHKVLLEKYDNNCFFQEITTDDVDLGIKYSLNVTGSIENIGVHGAMDQLVSLARTNKHDYFLFLENDWHLIEDERDTDDIISQSCHLLSTGKADIIHLRHSIKPGEPLYCICDRNVVDKNSKRKLSSRFWGNPCDKYPEFIQQETIDNRNWFFTTSQHECWTNNPFICTTSFMQKVCKTIKENLEEYKKQKEYKQEIINYRGVEDIMTTGKTWFQKNYKVAATGGLFTHIK